MYNTLLSIYKFEKLFVRTCVCDTIMCHEKVYHKFAARTYFYLWRRFPSAMYSFKLSSLPKLGWVLKNHKWDLSDIYSLNRMCDPIILISVVSKGLPKQFEQRTLYTSCMLITFSQVYVKPLKTAQSPWGYLQRSVASTTGKHGLTHRGLFLKKHSFG